MKIYIIAFVSLFAIGMLILYAGFKFSGPMFTFGFISALVFFQISHKLAYNLWFSDDNIVIITETHTIIAPAKPQKPQSHE